MSSVRSRRARSTSRPRASHEHVESSSPHSPSPSPSSSSSWFSSNPEKAEGEAFFLKWGICWISLMAFIVATRWFEIFTPWHYMITGLVIALPPVIIPIVCPRWFPHGRSVPFLRRYTTKCNVYIWVLSWNANYFWTHYFYSVLKTSYTFEAHRLNDVPFALYLITHSYFHFYHVISAAVLRKIYKIFGSKISALSVVTVVSVLFFMSFVVAFMETFTIQNFQYYDIPDRQAMYLYGSIFYGLYFIVSFPMALRLDEHGNTWSISRSFIDSMGASMMITQLLDFWRLAIGPICDKQPARPTKQTVPFIF